MKFSDNAYFFCCAFIEWTNNREEVTAAVKERKLNYRFHDPNPAAATADYILKVLIEANAGKVEAAIQNAAAAIPKHREKVSL